LDLFVANYPVSIATNISAPARPAQRFLGVCQEARLFWGSARTPARIQWDMWRRIW